MEKIKAAIKRAKNQNGAKSTAHKRHAADFVNKADTVKSRSEDLEPINYTKTKIIELDHQHLERNRIIAHDRSDKTVLSIDNLRTQILQKMYENDWKSIAVVSPTEGCGKTFVSINLAISIANQPNKTVMLVDTDLRRPKVAKYLGIQVQQSMTDFFAGKVGIDDIMINIGIPRLVILPTMAPVVNSAEALSSAKTDDFINDTYTRYDSRIIIYDLPPVLSTDDSLIMMRKVDCVLLVVGSGMVKEDEVEETMHHVPKEKLIGVVFNKEQNVTAEGYYY